MTAMTVTASGHGITETWRQVSGATGVEVHSASLVLRAAPAGSSRNLGRVAGAANDVSQLVVQVPGGERSVRTVKLNGFSRRDGDDTIQMREAGDLDERLSVAVIDSGSGEPGAPVHVVPRVPKRGSVPPQLGGASFSGGVLTMPDLRATEIELTRVGNDFPEEFETRTFSVSSVDMAVAPYPEGLTVSGPDGAPLFALPGHFGPDLAPASVDLRVPLELALAAALDAGSALSATFTVTADVDGDVQTDGITSSGAVLRVVRDAISVDVAGRRLPLPIGGAPLDDRTPCSVTADITVSYDGLRLHELSASVPADAGGLGGPVVGSQPVLSSFPPQALAGERVARIGLVGWPVGETDLTVHVIGIAGGAAGEPLTEPGVATLAPAGDDGGNAPRVVWVDLPVPAEIRPPAGVTVTATRGAFRWVAAPAPLLLLAVADPDPSGRPVQIGSTSLPVTEPRQTFTGHALAAASFAGAPPTVTSELFCTVHLANLTLRYQP